MAKIYLIGSLRNERVPVVANALRDCGHEVFDDWYAAGPEADDYWKKYEQARGRTYAEALQGYAAEHVFDFDKRHLLDADVGVLMLPAGRSGHMECGILAGLKLAGFDKSTVILLDDVDRWDVMYKFVDHISPDIEDLITWLR